MSERWVRGVASEVGDGKHCLFADVDDVADLDALVRRLVDVAVRFRLPDVAVRRSSRGCYHVLSMCSRTADDIEGIQRAIGADAKYIEAGARRGVWLLRTESLPDAQIERVALIRTGFEAEADASKLQHVEFPRERDEELTHGT